MNPLHSSRPARRRRAASLRPTLDALEERVVLSQAAVAPRAGIAEVRSLAASPANGRLSLPIVLDGITILNSSTDASTGARSFQGIVTGTVLGQGFATPVSGTITPARNARQAPSVRLTLEPLDLSRLGLNVASSPITLDVTAQRGRAGQAFRDALAAALSGQNPSNTALGDLLGGGQVLSMLNGALGRARVQLRGFAAGPGGGPASLGLTLGQVHVAGSGVDVRGGPVTVNVAGSPGGGLLGGPLQGLTGGGRLAQVRQAVGALQQVAGTAVPASTLLASSPMVRAAGTGTPSTSDAQTVLSLDLPPINLNLLGLKVQTSEIQVKVSAQEGSGDLLGNLLSVVGGLVNLQGVNNALNNVLGNVVTLVNSATLSVSGVGSGGPLQNVAPATTPVADVSVAPIHLNLLGALVDTSPIHLTITAQSGPGLVLGNAVADLAGLLDTPPPGGKLNLDYLAGRLQALNNELDATIPGISAPTVTPITPTGNQVLDLIVPPLDVNLLGLLLKTSQIEVNASANSGNGDLLGNLVNDLLNTLDATPGSLGAVNDQVNRLLGKVVAVLNASTLSLPSTAIGSLSQVLQTLALPDLITATPGATADVLNLVLATPDSTPPVDVNLLGLVVTTSDIQAQLQATTGDGQVLGNLVYNVSHLIDPNGGLGLIPVLTSLGA